MTSRSNVLRTITFMTRDRSIQRPRDRGSQVGPHLTETRSSTSGWSPRFGDAQKNGIALSRRWRDMRRLGIVCRLGEREGVPRPEAVCGMNDQIQRPVAAVRTRGPDMRRSGWFSGASAYRDRTPRCGRSSWAGIGLANAPLASAYRDRSDLTGACSRRTRDSA